MLETMAKIALNNMIKEKLKNNIHLILTQDEIIKILREYTLNEFNIAIMKNDDKIDEIILYFSSRDRK